MKLCHLLATLAVLSFAPSASAENIPDLFLHQNQSLSGEWQIIVDPYESGFYDYRWTQRDKSDNPNRSETFYLDAHPKDSSERIEYDFDKSPSLKVPGDWNTQKPELFYTKAASGTGGNSTSRLRRAAEKPTSASARRTTAPTSI